MAQWAVLRLSAENGGGLAPGPRKSKDVLQLSGKAKASSRRLELPLFQRPVHASAKICTVAIAGGWHRSGREHWASACIPWDPDALVFMYQQTQAVSPDYAVPIVLSMLKILRLKRTGFSDSADASPFPLRSTSPRRFSSRTRSLCRA